METGHQIGPMSRASLRKPRLSVRTTVTSNAIGLGGCVPVTARELPQLRISHLDSEFDESILVADDLASAADEMTTGYTEWTGIWRGAEVTIGWDWGLLCGQMRLLNPREIRTNIQVLADDGTPESPVVTRIYLHRWLETVPWAAAVARCVAEKQGGRAEP
jgi:hypothetical protein